VKTKRASSNLARKRQVACVRLERIVSGGQTGADRAALDFAIEHGVPHGGWCPQGRVSEDGAIDAGYALQETPTPDYTQRTEWNVRDSDGTVIFSISAKLNGGSKVTEDFAAALGKPCLHLSVESDGEQAVNRLCEFIQQHKIRVLNVAGPRSSNEPGVGAFVREVLTRAVGQVGEPGRAPSTGDAAELRGRPTVRTSSR
jgi:hypothetical protein